MISDEIGHGRITAISFYLNRLSGEVVRVPHHKIHRAILNDTDRHQEIEFHGIEQVAAE